MGDRTYYSPHSNVPNERLIAFKFSVDAGNAPALVASPLNVFVSSVSRVAQGQYRLTLADTYRSHVDTKCDLNVAAATACWAQPGPVANFGTSSLPTVDIFLCNNAGAAIDPPAADPNVFVSGTVKCCDISAV